MKEEDLEPPITVHLRRQGYAVEPEFEMNGKRVDLVGYGRGRSIVCVELKLRDWKRAVRQASYHRSWSDFSYIAMPEAASRLMWENRALIQELGIGVYVVDTDTGCVETLWGAKRSTWIKTENRDHALNRLPSLLVW